MSHRGIWDDLMLVLNNIIKAQILLKGWLTFLMPVTVPYGLLLRALWRPPWLAGVLNPPVGFQRGRQLWQTAGFHRRVRPSPICCIHTQHCVTASASKGFNILASQPQSKRRPLNKLFSDCCLPPRNRISLLRPLFQALWHRCHAKQSPTVT